VEWVREELTAARLVVRGREEAGRKYIEPAHDVLVKGWEKLRQWSKDGFEEIQLRDQLNPAVLDWEGSWAGLWDTSPRLDQLRDDLASPESSWLNRDETRFFRKSVELRRWNRFRRRAAMAAICALMVAVGVGVARLNSVQNRLATELVDALVSADPNAVRKAIAELSSLRARTEPIVDSRIEHSRLTPGARLRLRLARIDRSEQDRQAIVKDCVGVPPPDWTLSEYRLVGNQLLGMSPGGKPWPEADAMKQRLWDTATSVHKPGRRRALILATLAAHDQSESLWRRALSDPTVIDSIARVDSTEAPEWVESIRPVRDFWLPPLMAIFFDRNRPEAERSVAAILLAGLHKAEPAEPEALVALMGDAEVLGQMKPLADGLLALPAALRTQALTRLRCIYQDPAPTLNPERSMVVGDPAENAKDRRRANDPVENAKDRRRANAAATLLLFDEKSPAWEVLAYRDNPLPATYLVRSLRPIGILPRMLADRLRLPGPDHSAEPCVTARIILALGEYPVVQLADDILTLVASLYQEHDDPGVHSAAEWTLGRWNRPIPAVARPAPSAPLRGPAWYTDAQGHTLAAFPEPGAAFLMGLPKDSAYYTLENETLHLRTIPRSFAIATKETTVEQFERFKQGFRKWLDKDRVENDKDDPRRTPQRHEPITYVTWYEAAAYCNWLSWKNDIPPDQWCYPPEIWNATFLVPTELMKDQSHSPVVLKITMETRLLFKRDPLLPDDSHLNGLLMPADSLDRTGYRLPTEAEWEYACRAGAAAEAIRFFGRDESMLADYAKYQTNTPDTLFAPVATYKPNGFGLFDTLGNAAEWCHGRLDYPQTPPPTPLTDVESGPLAFPAQKVRMLRGGSHYERAEVVRCSFRQREEMPIKRSSEMGFRVARTLPRTSPRGH